MQDRYVRPPWKERVKAQGFWDEDHDPWPSTGAPAMPMPVEISDEESLAPFFAHIGGGGSFDTQEGETGLEAFYEVGLKEWYVHRRQSSDVPFSTFTFAIHHFMLLICTIPMI